MLNMIIYSGMKLFSWSRNLMMLMKKIMVTYGRQLKEKIALHTFLYASYPIVGSKTYMYSIKYLYI